MKIGIILGSIREGRAGASVAQWVADQAATREDATFEIVDLKSFDVPLLTDPTVPGAANRQYSTPEVTAWGEAIDGYDGFIFVTPEYNHGVPGAFKNAVDSIYPEWFGKAVAFVSYGAESGVRAVEQWRPIVANLNMWDVRAQVSLNTFTEFGAEGVTPNERRPDELTTLLDQLVAATAATKSTRTV